MKKIILTILLAFFYAFFVSSVFAATYYVSTTGNDNNNGSQSSRWRTIQKAANTLNSGDTVIVSVGTYGETVSVSRSGITFQANDVVTMKGFNITGNNMTVSGFRIDDSPGYGVELRGSNSTIKNNIITKAKNACILAAGQNFLIENNDCSHTIQPTTNGGDADCFRYFGGGHTFRGNYCHDIPWDGVLVRDAHTDCFQTWDWTSLGGVGHDILFEKNVCILPFRGGGFAAKIWQAEEGAYNLTMKNNIGVAGLMALIFDGTNISFLNNTFIGYRSDSDGLHLQNTDITLKNNIFAHQQQRVIENIGSSSTITASNNCLRDNTSRRSRGRQRNRPTLCQRVTKKLSSSIRLSLQR
ncbi:MAG: right-handed parallel beta-helix repeat-containing protein [Patescibacteria group bacterium]